MAREPDLIAVEGAPLSIIWDSPVTLRSLGVIGLATLVTLILTAAILPMFSREDRRQDSPAWRTRQDLDALRQAISLHDSQNPPLRGTSYFGALSGRYCQEVPSDPWRGRPYLLDADVGVLVSAGADDILGPGDDYEDEDIVVHYKPELRIEKVTWSGAPGIPRPGDTLLITWNKAYHLRDGRDPLQDLVLILNGGEELRVPLSGGPLIDRSGVPVDIQGTRFGWFKVRWAYDARASRPEEGVMIIKCVSPELDHREHRGEVRIGAGMSIDVFTEVIRRSAGGEASLSVIEAMPAEGGPCDRAVFGADAIDPGRAFPTDTGSVEVQVGR